MSGVLIDGVQYERCNCCGQFAAFDALRYDRASGREMCPACAALPREAQDELAALVKRVWETSDSDRTAKILACDEAVEDWRREREDGS